MKHSVPQISKYMTTSPISIDVDAAIREADTLMSVNHFRHLPVIRNGKPVGILSDRDLKLARGLVGVNLNESKVGDIAQMNLYCVSPNALVDEVAGTMADKKIGSAVVVQNDKIVGIFTTTDALIALCHALSK